MSPICEARCFLRCHRRAITAFAAVIMSKILIVALLCRPATRFHGTIGWVSLSSVVVYLLSSYEIYLHG
jgi:cation:H+ antiporter